MLGLPRISSLNKAGSKEHATRSVNSCSVLLTPRSQLRLTAPPRHAGNLYCPRTIQGDQDAANGGRPNELQLECPQQKTAHDSVRAKRIGVFRECAKECTRQAMS